MPIQGRYLFTASMDVRADKEALFNEVYDTEHVPLLSEVPGVVSVARFKTQELTLAIGGELRTIVVENEPRYTAVYELESADVITGEAWAAASEQGRWPAEVRPYTLNRRHTLKKLILPGEAD